MIVSKIIDWIKSNANLVIAIYGAVLATIAIGWNIYNNLQDRAKIKVETKFGFMVGDNSKKHLLFVNVMNFGKRPITLSSMGLRAEDGGNLLNLKTISLPYELGEGKSHPEWFDIEVLKGRNWKFAWYKDETGKLYKSKSIDKMIKAYFKSKENTNFLVKNHSKENEDEQS